MTNKPHDALARRTLSRPEIAGCYLRAVLPESLTQHLNLDALELVPGTHVDPNLSERQSDFLYRVQFADEDALLYVLLEHQSRADPLMAARLFVYLARVLDRWCADNTKATRVPALVPVVLYSGRHAWTAPTSLRDLYAVPAHAAAIRDSLPQLAYRVDDLRRTPDEELLSREAPSFGRVALVFLKHGVDRVPELLRFLRTQGGMFEWVKNPDDLLTLFSYIFKVASVGTEEVLAALHPVLKPKTREVAVTAAEQLIAQGREEGRLDGERRTLLRLLSRRFSVTPEIEARVGAALEPELILWLDRILDATSLDDVFKPVD